MLTLLHPSLDGSYRCVCHLARAVSNILWFAGELEDGTFTQRPRGCHHFEEHLFKHGARVSLAIGYERNRKAT